jgi:uncharacterized protein YraI
MGYVLVVLPILLALVMLAVIWSSPDLRTRGPRLLLVALTLAGLSAPLYVWRIWPSVTAGVREAENRSAEEERLLNDRGTVAALVANETRWQIADTGSSPLPERLRLVTLSRLNLRREPATAARVDQVLPGGAEVIFRGESGSRSRDWLRVAVAKKRGWVKSRYLRVAYPQPSLRLSAWSGRPLITMRATQVRASPNSGARVIGRLAAGEKIKATWYRGPWVQLDAGARKGWVDGRAVRPAGNGKLAEYRRRAVARGLRFAFPERTLAGKVCGWLLMFLISVLGGCFLRHFEVLDYGAFFVSLSIFMSKNWPVLSGLSPYEFLWFQLSMGIASGISGTLAHQVVLSLSAMRQPSIPRPEHSARPHFSLDRGHR